MPSQKRLKVQQSGAARAISLKGFLGLVKWIPADDQACFVNLMPVHGGR